MLKGKDEVGIMNYEIAVAMRAVGGGVGVTDL
jgi:hypothetical protein